MSPRRYYSTDLTEAQWAFLFPLLPARKWHSGGPGRPPCDLRRVINGIVYLLKTGCQWRMRDNVGKLLEFLVGALQFCRPLDESFF